MLTKSGIHAVRALIALAEAPAGTLVDTTTLAERTLAPRNYLGKLLHQLSRSRLVSSQKGVGGGFQLARPAETITLYDIVGAIEDMGRWNECILGRPNCNDEKSCPVHRRWAPVRNGIHDVLRGTRLTDLVPRDGSAPYRWDDDDTQEAS